MQDQSDSETPSRKIHSLRSTYESCDVALFSCESHIFEEAVQDDSWRDVMDEKISTIEKNHTWELVDLPERKVVTRAKMGL